MKSKLLIRKEMLPYINAEVKYKLLVYNKYVLQVSYTDPISNQLL